DDLTDIYLSALTDDRLVGPVNAVSPAPVRNTEYTRALAAVLRRPAVLKVPHLGPRLLLGQDGARELAFAGQRVRPRRLREIRHVFRHERVEMALAHLLGTTMPASAGESE
ncbi:MAG: DUF1731 domain-containing protein, partial [Actinomycetes bacterium]